LIIIGRLNIAVIWKSGLREIKVTTLRTMRGDLSVYRKDILVQWTDYKLLGDMVY
jgi:hypothetical protein